MSSLIVQEQAFEGLMALDSLPTRIERARFPFSKTIEDFDLRLQPALNDALLCSLLSPSFVSEGRSLVLSGKPGRGKTHLAVAIARRALEHGHDVLFVSAAEVVDAIADQTIRGRRRGEMTKYLRVAVLVLDDIGYVGHNTQAASILFQIASERHRFGRSMIVTASQPPAQWGELLGDHHAADAIAGRILERGLHIELSGPSMRATRHVGDVTSAGELPAAAAEQSGTHPVLRLAQPLPEISSSEDCPALCRRVARELVGRVGLKEAIHLLRGAMNSEALERSRGSRRAAANLLGVDRRYVQRLAGERADGSAKADDLP